MLSKIDMAKIKPGDTIVFADGVEAQVYTVLHHPVQDTYTIETNNSLPILFSNQGISLDHNKDPGEWDLIKVKRDDVEWPEIDGTFHDEWIPTPKDQPTKIPKILVSGYAHSGKTTFCHYLKLAGMNFKDTSKIAIEQIWNVGVFEGAYESPEALEADKDTIRPMMYSEICLLNKADPTTLARIALEQSDIYCGMRSKRELYGCYDADLFDLTIWIDRMGTKESKESCTVDENDFDLIIENTGSIFDLKRKAERLAKVLMR